MGGFGTTSPELAAAWDLDVPPVVMELDLNFLVGLQEPKPQSSLLSEFPGMKIDMAFVLERTHTYEEVYHHILNLNLDNLESLSLFDVYQGKAVGTGKKSLGLRFRFRSTTRTLTSDEVSTTMDRVVTSVSERFGATLRT